MKTMTDKSMHEAFSGESQAHMKYLNFAHKAVEEGFGNVAKLFRAISYAEQIHASNHLKVFAGVQGTAENLQAAIDGENFEVEEMYPAYDAIVTLQKENNAKKSIYYALEAEKIHAKMYQDARTSVVGGKDIDLSNIYICNVCGYTSIDQLPDNCPVCKAEKEQFATF